MCYCPLRESRALAQPLPYLASMAASTFLTSLSSASNVCTSLNTCVISSFWILGSGVTASHLSHFIHVVLAQTTWLISLQYVTAHNSKWLRPSLNHWSIMDCAPSNHAWPVSSFSLLRKSSLGIGLSARQPKLLWGFSLLNQVLGLDVIRADDHGGRDFLSKSATEIFWAGNLVILCDGIARAMVQASITKYARSLQEYTLFWPIHSSRWNVEGSSKLIILLSMI